MIHKLLMICAGGLSSSLFVDKLAQHYKDNKQSLTISAAGIYDYKRYVFDADIIILGPQIAYKAKEMTKYNKPVIVLNSYDYTLCNMDNIKKVIDDVYAKQVNSH